MRVLIADGDRAVLEAAECHLTHHGHEVKVAMNGLECVDILQRFVPDVVVLEQTLLWGGSDGVLAFMLQDPGLSAIPVLLTSDDMVLAKIGCAASQALPAERQQPYRLEELSRHLQDYDVDNTLNPA